MVEASTAVWVKVLGSSGTEMERVELRMLWYMSRIFGRIGVGVRVHQGKCSGPGEGTPVMVVRPCDSFHDVRRTLSEPFWGCRVVSKREEVLEAGGEGQISSGAG